ncbi:MAG: monofunctional biosynthetic peptidoglycan transglycosylase, partial [Proteobacteria bacterium]|nr:monofunctional biosynthetic peptidoglycan transglycosylase [Pseudomonadota bacterium]
TIGEDDKFWVHEGFDLEGMKDALVRNLEGDGPMAGGSTITQQLAKNLYFSPSKSPIRKLNEAIVTWRMERALSKKRILELYLNCIEWGDGIFGIGAAASHYYGKTPSQLSRLEAARLVAVLPNPIRWTPTGNSRTVAYRSKLIMQRMERRLNNQ